MYAVVDAGHVLGVNRVLQGRHDDEIGDSASGQPVSPRLQAFLPVIKPLGGQWFDGAVVRNINVTAVEKPSIASQDDLGRRRDAEPRHFRKIQPLDQSFAKAELVVKKSFEFGRETGQARSIELQLGAGGEPSVFLERECRVEVQRHSSERQADYQQEAADRTASPVLPFRSGSWTIGRKIRDGRRADLPNAGNTVSRSGRSRLRFVFSFGHPGDPLHLAGEADKPAHARRSSIGLAAALSEKCSIRLWIP